MANQPIRGNPELKQVWLNSNFSGGMNITYADDLLGTNMARNLVNYDIESVGELVTRKGFGESSALTELLYPSGSYHNAGVNISTQKEVFFTLLQNDNSAWQRLADSVDVATYLATYGQANSMRYLRLLVNANGTLYWEDIKVEVKTTPVFTKYTGTLNVCTFVHNDNLINWNYVDKYGRLYFTSNDKGLVIFDSESSTPSTPWTYAGDFTTNSAYKPNAIEARKIGFNVIGDEPLSWLYESELTTESIQGVYLTTADRTPIKVVPGSEFQVNILYTGDVYVFTLALNEYGNAINLTATKNTTYSVDGSLAVYDVKLETQPTDELEFVIKFDSESVALDPYYDYYPTGQIPSGATPVSQLNVGKMKITEMYDRLVYYGGNAVWFSEVDVYDYIPNYNYVLLPLDKTDEIVKIQFFRTSYVVFTKRRIYKLTGDFENTSFNLQLINDNIGCISPDTTMVVDNQMYFVSTQGLRALKTDQFRENLENVREFDEAVRPLIIGDEKMTAIAYKDQYVLMTNLRGAQKSAVVNLREYDIPDQIRYYYKQNAFVTDKYASGNYPRFMFMENGELYSLNSDGVFRLGEGHSDFGTAFDALIETIAYNLGYPTHEKKVKAVLIKAGGGNYEQAIIVQVAADGQLVVSSELTPIGVDGNGDVIYADSNIVVEIGDSSPIDTMYGDGITKYHTKKFRATARGKNLAIRLLTNFQDRFSVQALGYIYKLGKVRE